MRVRYRTQSSSDRMQLGHRLRIRCIASSAFTFLRVKARAERYSGSSSGSLNCGKGAGQRFLKMNKYNWFVGVLF